MAANRFSEAVLMTPDVDVDSGPSLPPSGRVSMHRVRVVPERPSMSRDSLCEPHQSTDQRIAFLEGEALALRKASRFSGQLIIVALLAGVALAGAAVVFVVMFRKLKSEVRGLKSSVTTLMSAVETTPEEAVEALAEKPEFIQKVSLGVYQSFNRLQAKIAEEHRAKVMEEQKRAHEAAQRAKIEEEKTKSRDSPNPEERYESDHEDLELGQEEQENQEYEQETREEEEAEEESDQDDEAEGIFTISSPNGKTVVKTYPDASTVINVMGDPVEHIDAIARAVRSLGVSCDEQICTRTQKSRGIVEELPDEEEERARKEAESSSSSSSESTPSPVEEEEEGIRLEEPSIPEAPSLSEEDAGTAKEPASSPEAKRTPPKKSKGKRNKKK